MRSNNKSDVMNNLSLSNSTISLRFAGRHELLLRDWQRFYQQQLPNPAEYNCHLPEFWAVTMLDELAHELGPGSATPDERAAVVVSPDGDDAGCGIPPPEPLVLPRLSGDDSVAVVGHLARGRARGGGLRAGELRLARFEHFHREREVASFARMERADADDLARDFLAFVVAYGHEDGVFPRLTVVGVPQEAVELERGKTRRGARGGARLEAKMLLTSRTTRRALENYCAAVGAESRRPRCRRSNTGHDARLVVPSVSPGRDWPSSPHPNSARPRMREPAANVTVPAFKSPFSTPESRSSTR